MTTGMEDMRITMAAKAQDGIIFNKEGRKFKLNQPFRTTQLVFPNRRGVYDRHDQARVAKGDTQEIIAEPIEQQPFRTTQLIFAGTKAILDKNDISKVQRGDQEEIIAEPIDKQPFRTNVLLGPKGRSINEVKAGFNDPDNFDSSVPPLFEATETYEAIEKQPFRTLSVIHPEPKNLPKIKKNLEDKVKFETPAPSLFDYAPAY